MLILCRFVVALLPLLLPVCCATADEPVDGPPEMIFDARIEDDTPNGKLFVGATMNWDQSRQSWNSDRTIEQGGKSYAGSIDRGRSVLVVRRKRFTTPFDKLQFAYLNGDVIDSSAIGDLLGKDRAVMFLHKGTVIHPAIANLLDPKTVVVTRINYPVDPLVIGIPEKR
ncbi:hypothetical protein N9L06_07450 [Mariniblastus sp.]|nr:hypothetical protein [Mariniblastus sp.]